MQLLLLGSILFLGLLFRADGYGSGAPRQVCRELIPGHGRSYAGTYYKIAVQTDTYSPRLPVKVTITGNPLSGWVMQARRAGSRDPTPVGQFYQSYLPSGAKTMKCSRQDDTVTHDNPILKYEALTFLWVPPSYDVGDIEFIATIAYKKDIWFSGVKSRVLRAAGY